MDHTPQSNEDWTRMSGVKGSNRRGLQGSKQGLCYKGEQCCQKITILKANDSMINKSLYKHRTTLLIFLFIEYS